jgi:hypothetical protein
MEILKKLAVEVIPPSYPVALVFSIISRVTYTLHNPILFHPVEEVGGNRWFANSNFIDDKNETLAHPAHI